MNTGTAEIDPDPATFEGQILKFKSWITTRMAWLDANMPGDISNCALFVSENENHTLRLFPNPTHDYFYIESTTTPISTKAEIQISDVLGRTVHQTTIKSWNEPVFSILGYNSGTYLVKVFVDSKNFTTKLVIE